MQAILSVSTEPRLLYTRGLVLERSGASVTSATPAQAMLLLREQSFEVIVFCHSLPNQDAQRVYELSRIYCPTSRLLVIKLWKLAAAPRVPADVFYLLEDGPRILVQVAQDLLWHQDAARNQNIHASASVPSGCEDAMHAMSRQGTPIN